MKLLFFHAHHKLRARIQKFFEIIRKLLFKQKSFYFCETLLRKDDEIYNSATKKE